jgi:preprotein translocase subunit SecF
VEFFHKKTNFPFMATRRVWYTLSAVLMIGSFVSFIMIGLNFAIDFTGGISVEVAFPQDASIEKTRSAFEAAGTTNHR